MSSETFSYKGISAGKYIEGEIEAINQEEASFKLKEQKVIITNLTKVKKKKAEKDKKKGWWIFIWKKESKARRCNDFLQTVCNNGKSWIANIKCSGNVKRSN